MRFCSRVSCVVNDGWRVRCLHWVAVVLVGFVLYCIVLYFFVRFDTYVAVDMSKYIHYIIHFFAFHPLGSVEPTDHGLDLIRSLVTCVASDSDQKLQALILTMLICVDLALIKSAPY
jgi:hypothetical protein